MSRDKWYQEKMDRINTAREARIRSMMEMNERTEKLHETTAFLAKALEDEEKKELRAENNLLRFCLKNCTCFEEA